MDAVLRALAVYAFVLVVVRLSGRRTLGQMSAFDFVLLLIIGECTQQALLGDDFSLTNAGIAILTLVSLDIGLSLVKARVPRLERAIDGVPTVLVENGEMLRDRMAMARVDEADILEQARIKQGLASMREIRFAVLERSGDISIIPRRDD
jgi:uncharacterized membrane protein YcaP (DUF421 family)